MSVGVDYEEEQLNFFRLCSLVTTAIPDGLRILFQQEWDSRYQASHGKWEGSTKNVTDFHAMESTKTGIRKNPQLLKIVNCGDWQLSDCTLLCQAILFSDSIGRAGLRPIIQSNVHNLRELRNCVAHKAGDRLEEKDFRTAVQKAVAAFSSLNLDTSAIKKIEKQRSFTTEEVLSLRKKIDEEGQRIRLLEEDLQREKDKTYALEEELKAEPQPFCVLPPKPSHETVSRQNEVEKLMEKMKMMKTEKINELTTIYLSGNPGCGKSQVARQIGERFYKETGKANSIRFVMTLDAESEEKLFRSYTDLAIRVGCTQYSVSNILKSENCKLQEKIDNLITMTAPKLKIYSSWLLIIDNVTDLKRVCQYWPRSGETAWGNGQLLITTQDSASVSTDSLTFHKSFSEGMEVDDALETLKEIAGFTSGTEIEAKVVELLDRQPLALACAAVYVRSLREAGQPFNWENYIEKFKQGKRESTEKIFKQKNLSYPEGMFTAVKLALEREINNSVEMKTVLEYLSLLAPDPLPLDHIVNYVTQFMPDGDQDLLEAKVTASSLILFSGKESREIRIHKVVHQCLVRSIFTGDELPNTNAITVAMQTFTPVQTFDPSDVSDILNSQKMVSHFSEILKRIDNIWEQNPKTLKGAWEKENEIENISILWNMGRVCLTHSFLQSAQSSFIITLHLEESMLGPNHPHVARTLNNLGNTALHQGHYEEAKNYYQRSLEITETVLGPNHPDVATTLNNLGSTADSQGHYEEAKNYYQRSLEIYETVLGPNHPDVATTLNNLGSTADSQGHYEEAKNYYQRSLEVLLPYLVKTKVNLE